MPEELIGQVLGAVDGVFGLLNIDEVAKLLNMPSSRNQVDYGTVVLLGVATAAVAAVLGGIVYFKDRRAPWNRRSKHHLLTKQQWLESFEPREAWLAIVTAELLFEIFNGESLFRSFATMFLKRRCVKKVENVDERRVTSILDLPELVIEGVLSKLSAATLCQASGVCREFRVRCRSDHLWKSLFQEKWGSLAGPAAYREWQRTLALRSDTGLGGERNCKVWAWPLSCLWPFSWFISGADAGKTSAGPPPDSLMSWYLALESGSFWFPAQIYNRENGHVGFMLSCYDAEVSYDRVTDTFRARYPPHGPRTIVVEDGVPWSRLRSPPIDTSAHDLHVSDCLEELRPGDHVEVQWRRNKEFPYGWWYGIVGHVENCRGDTRLCRCHLEDTVWLEFNQYTVGSRWRQAAVDRKSHLEEGNEAEGFYGGVRKLRTKDEISIWRHLWPLQALE